MKLKTIVTILLVSLISTSAMAQGRSHSKNNSKNQTRPQTSYNSYSSTQNTSKIGMVYGVAAGVTCPIINIEGNGADVSSHVGFKAGIMWGVDLGMFEIVPEVWYSTFKMDFKGDASGLKGAQVKNSSIDFPIMVGIPISKRMKINLGPTFSLMCNNDVTYENGDSEEFGPIKNSVGYVAGVSYKVISNFIVDFRYSGRFSNYNNQYSQDPYKIRLSTIDITAGFRF